MGRAFHSSETTSVTSTSFLRTRSYYPMTSASRLLSLLVLVLALAASAPTAQAQRSSGAAGIGGQVGDPSGLTLKVYNANAASYEVLAAWSSINDFFFLNGHALFETGISAQNVSQPLDWFIGPGGFVGTFETGGAFGGELVLGISGTVGIEMVLADHFELYLRATPRFAFVPETSGDLGGGLGLRYYF